jgi:signal transduction histidine kinase
MTRRDRVLVAVALALVLGLAALVVQTVLDARQRGVEALEEQKRQQVDQLARSLDTRVMQIFDAFGGVTSLPYELVPGSAADQQVLDGLQAQQPDAGLGYLLVDADATVTVGTSLLDPSSVGRPLDRLGLDDVLEQGRPAFLPAVGGLTTAASTIGVAWPLLDASTGAIRGALVVESEIAPDSGFNEEVQSLASPDGGSYLVLDSTDAVVASSDAARLGDPIADRDIADAAPGLRRVDGRIVVVGEVPSAQWRAVFVQDAHDFEGGLTQRLQFAVLLIIVVGILAGGLGLVALVGRLRAARHEQQRLAEINQTREQFLSIVSHELRTPVAGVVGFLQTALDHWHQLDDEHRRETVARAASNARRLQALTRDVLDVTNVDRGALDVALGPLDLREEVTTAVQAMRDADPDRAITVEVPGEQVRVRGDGDRIFQVLLNLFENASQSSPSDAPVDIELRVADGEACVSVTDHGPGIGPDERDAVFEKFVRGRAAGIRGSGLGLFLCRQIVDAHGGRIWVEDAPHGGARFTFVLPVDPVAAPSVSGS